MNQQKIRFDPAAGRRKTPLLAFVIGVVIAVIVVVWWVDGETEDVTGPLETDGQIERQGTEAEGMDDTDPVDVPQTTDERNPQDQAPDPVVPLSD
ncbi:MAG: hypothetical protein P1U72_20400 [Paracoccaceae bacterium]|nr:hypothetical protein [Paracoccaceae bacterium]